MDAFLPRLFASGKPPYRPYSPCVSSFLLLERWVLRESRNDDATASDAFSAAVHYCAIHKEEFQ